MQKPYRVLYCVLEWGPLLRCLGEDCEAPEPGLRPPRRPPLTHGALAGTPPPPSVPHALAGQSLWPLPPRLRPWLPSRAVEIGGCASPWGGGG